MSEIIKAARTEIRLGAIALEVFMLPDGGYRLSQTQVAGTVGKPERSFRNFLTSKASEAIHWQNFEFPIIWCKEIHPTTKGVPFDCALAYWQKEARKGNQKAMSLLEVLGDNNVSGLESYRGIHIICSDKDYKKARTRKQKVKKHSEAWYVKNLQKHLGGSIEVPIPAGNIDLLTSIELIECKEVKQWKSALGQVLVYGDYYPSHQKRIHIFGDCHESFLRMIEGHCAKWGVAVTWEP
jgi:hypothetical protein